MTTPQQNGVVERKNRTLQEMARTMIHENNLAKHIYEEGVNTTCYVQNRIYIRPFWIFVCWLQFCLKQIFTSGLEHDVPTSRHGFVCYVPCFVLRTRYFI